jgi:hypothetical protein
LFGIGLNASSDLQDVTRMLRAEAELEFLARTVGRYDMIATLSFNSLRDFNRLMSRLLALPTVSYCEQWLHVQIVRERYEHTLDYMVASGVATAVT